MTVRFQANTGNEVHPKLVKAIEKQAANLAIQIAKAKDFVLNDGTGNVSVDILFPVEFNVWPEIVWFHIDTIEKGSARVLVECFERDSDAQIDMGVVLDA